MKYFLFLCLLTVKINYINAQELKPDHHMVLNANDEATLINGSVNHELVLWTKNGAGYVYLNQDPKPYLVREGGLAIHITGIVRIKSKSDGVQFLWQIFDIREKTNDYDISRIKAPDKNCLNDICGVVPTKILQVNSKDNSVFDFYTLHPNSCGNHIYRSFSPSPEIALRKFSLVLSSIENKTKINVAESKDSNGQLKCSSTRQEIDAIYLTPINIFSKETDL